MQTWRTLTWSVARRCCGRCILGVTPDWQLHYWGGIPKENGLTREFLAFVLCRPRSPCASDLSGTGLAEGDRDKGALFEASARLRDQFPGRFARALLKAFRGKKKAKRRRGKGSKDLPCCKFCPTTGDCPPIYLEEAASASPKGKEEAPGRFADRSVNSRQFDPPG
jgi:hypothetical protein